MCNDPQGVALLRRHADRLDPGACRTLCAAAGTSSNTLDAAAWLRERSATLPTQMSDADAFTTEPALPDRDGIVSTRERLAEIDGRRRALNRQEFADNPSRLRANQTAISTPTPSVTVPR